jgi:hypothetical protein
MEENDQETSSIDSPNKQNQIREEKKRLTPQDINLLVLKKH